MPRYLNALAENTPSLSSFTLVIPRLDEEEEGEPAALLSHDFISKVTRCLINDLPERYEDTGTSVYLKHLHLERGADGQRPFKPDIVQMNSYSFICGLEDAGIWGPAGAVPCQTTGNGVSFDLIYCLRTSKDSSVTGRR
jgi:hypothetical protein